MFFKTNRGMIRVVRRRTEKIMFKVSNATNAKGMGTLLKSVLTKIRKKGTLLSPLGIM